MRIDWFNRIIIHYLMIVYLSQSSGIHPSIVAVARARLYTRFIVIVVILDQSMMIGSWSSSLVPWSIIPVGKRHRVPMNNSILLIVFLFLFLFCFQVQTDVRAYTHTHTDTTTSSMEAGTRLIFGVILLSLSIINSTNAMKSISKLENMRSII